MGGDQCRVEVLTSGRVRVDHFGRVRDSTQYFNSVDELPEPIGGRLAVLSILPSACTVVGVGERVNSRIFWIDE